MNRRAPVRSGGRRTGRRASRTAARPAVAALAGALLLGAPAAAGTVPLSLQGAVLLALERSPRLRVERFQAVAQGTLPQEARGAFDPTVSATLSHGESQTPTTARESALETAGVPVRRGRDDQGRVELSQRLPTGTELDLRAESSRTRSNFAPEEFGASLEAEVTQPLLRGLRPSVNLARVRIAENQAEIGRYAFAGALQDLLAGVEGAYWDLAFAREAVAVRADSLEVGRRLLADAEARVEVGRLPALELAAARAEVAAREEALADARARLETARLELVRWLAPGERLPWSAELEPVDEPLPLVEGPDPEGSVATALEARPDLLEARLELTNRELEVIETRDGLLPRLDLFASYGHTGRNVTLGGAWGDIFDEGYEQWRLGLTVETPLGRRTEGARARRAGFQRARAEAAVRNLELLVEAEVRQAVVEVERLRRKVEFSRVTAEARQAEAQAEAARYRAGRTTSSDALQAESRHRLAQLEHQRARTEARKARAELGRLEGRLAARWGIELH